MSDTQPRRHPQRPAGFGGLLVLFLLFAVGIAIAFWLRTETPLRHGRTTVAAAGAVTCVVGLVLHRLRRDDPLGVGLTLLGTGVFLGGVAVKWVR